MKNPIWALMHSVRGRIYAAIAGSATSYLLNLAAMVMFAYNITQPQALTNLTWLLICLLLVAASTVLRLASFTISHLASYKLEVDLRSQIADKLASLPLGYITEHGSGRVAKLMQYNVTNLHAFVADSTPMLAKLYVAPLASLLVCAVFSWQLSLWLITGLTVGFVVLSRAMQGHGDTSALYEEKNAAFNQQAVEYIQAMSVVRAFDSGSQSYDRLHNTTVEFKELLTRWLAASGHSVRFAMWLFTPLPVLVWVGLGGWWLMHLQVLELSALAVVLLLSGGLVEGIMPLMWLNHAIKRSQDAATDIQQMLAQPSLPVPAQPEPVKFSKTPSIAVENLSFRYAGQQAWALQNMSFNIEPGQIVALVGASGSGKSTLARLLPRFWDPEHGRICIDGHDIRHLSSEQLMSQMAFVFQDNYLFDESLLDNLRLGYEHIDQALVEDAAKAAQIHDFIVSLPDGYQTMVGAGGVRLSGGQRQRIAIARALVQDKPILVLDEATAYADPDNEHLLMQAVAQLMQGRTVLIIAHKLNTIKDADQILVIDHGQLIERGTHDELLAKPSRYSQLWQAYENSQTWLLTDDSEEQRYA